MFLPFRADAPTRVFSSRGAWFLLTLLTVSAWAADAGAVKIACVGDSITFGYGLSDPDQQSYPAVLSALLGAQHEVENFGVSGATLLKQGDRPYWGESRFADSDLFGPDIVIVMLGTNDAKPVNWAKSAAFASDYQDLIDHYRELGAVVYVATPPSVFEPGAFEIAPEVVAAEVVPRVEQIARDAGTPLVDVFASTSGRAELFPDTVHPSAQGARLLAEVVLASLGENNFDAPASGGTGGEGGGGGAGGASALGGSGGLSLSAGGQGEQEGSGAAQAGGASGGDGGGGFAAAPTGGDSFEQAGGTFGGGGTSSAGGGAAGVGTGAGRAAGGSGGPATGGSADAPAAEGAGTSAGGCAIGRSAEFPGAAILLALGFLFGRRRAHFTTGRC